MLLVSLVHTLAVHTPLAFSTTGAIGPRKMLGLADKQPIGGASTPQKGTRASRIGTMFRLLSKCELALPIGII